MLNELFLVSLGTIIVGVAFFLTVYFKDVPKLSKKIKTRKDKISSARFSGVVVMLFGLCGVFVFTLVGKNPEMPFYSIIPAIVGLFFIFISYLMKENQI